MISNSKRKMQGRIWAADAYKIAKQFEVEDDLTPPVNWCDETRTLYITANVAIIKQRFGGKHGAAMHYYYIGGPQDEVRKLLREHCNKDRCILEMPII